MFGLDDIIGAGLKIIDKVIPDPAAKAEAQAKLLELQQSGQLKLEEFNVKREEIAANDRNSARVREAATGDSTNKIIAFIIVGLWGAMNFFIMFNGVPETVDDPVLYRLLGTLDAVVLMVLQYYFGSTASSRNKDSTIHNMAQK